MKSAVQAIAANEVAWFITDPHDPVQYEVHFDLPTDGNWSLKGLSDKDPARAARYKHRLGQCFSRRNLRRVLAPTVIHMSGTICDPSCFTEVTALPFGVTLLRPFVKCDGVPIGRHEACAISFGGCVLLVFTFRDHAGNPVCLVVHAGLASLVDLKLVHECEHSRPHFSVIDAAVAYARFLGADSERITLRAFGAVPWQAFRYSTCDREFGEKNFTLLNELSNRYARHGSSFIKACGDLHEHICLSSLIEIQAQELGIGTIDVHGRELELNGKLPYVTHDKPGLNGTMRYLATVIHR